jgi:hypothetical protein
MKPEHDRLGAGGVLSRPGECSQERLQAPEIVGQVNNPAPETLRRFWWRAFDRVCYWAVLTRLSIHDRIFGPEPPTLADVQREADHEHLVRAFPAAAGEAIEPTKHHAGQNGDGDSGSPYSYRRSVTILRGSACSKGPARFTSREAAGRYWSLPSTIDFHITAMACDAGIVVGEPIAANQTCTS